MVGFLLCKSVSNVFCSGGISYHKKLMSRVQTCGEVGDELI